MHFARPWSSAQPALPSELRDQQLGRLQPATLAGSPLEPAAKAGHDGAVLCGLHLAVCAASDVCLKTRYLVNHLFHLNCRALLWGIGLDQVQGRRA